MSQQEISRKYAKALFAIAKEKQNLDIVLGDLMNINKVFDEKEIKNFFLSPIIPLEQKIKLIKNSFNTKAFTEEVINLTILLTENSRLNVLNNLVDAFQGLIDLDSQITRGTVRAARPLAVDIQNSLEQKITQTLKKKIVLTFKEDPKTLGGVVAEVGGWTFDDSIETHLHRLNEELLKN